MPITYVLSKKDECIKFFEFFASEEYFKHKALQHVVFMEKLASGTLAHGATGVKPFLDEREDLVRERYDDGNKCGQISDNTVMQWYVPNPLTIEGHKFDIRVHFLVASIDPLIIYYYDGYFRVSPLIFDPNSDDPNGMLSNTHEGKLDKWFIELNYTGLADYLYKNKVIDDPDWAENSLRYRMKKFFIHLINSTVDGFSKDSNLYEMFGCDFLLDTDLKMWFIECNSDPSYSFPGRPKAARNTKMLIDHFEIMFGYLRSKLKRWIIFANDITKELGDKELSKEELQEYVIPKTDQFIEISKSRFEPEFVPSKQNSFVKIVDLNLSGPERYGNLFPKECV